MSANTFAKTKLPHIEFEKVLADKQSFLRGYGCVYAVVELPAQSPKTKPKSQNVDWLPTPIPKHILNPSQFVNGREICMNSDVKEFGEDGLPGAGLDGYGEAFLRIVRNEGAWAQVYGGSESQILTVYAPNERLAMYLRFGD